MAVLGCKASEHIIITLIINDRRDSEQMAFGYEPGQEVIAPPHYLKTFLAADHGSMDNSFPGLVFGLYSITFKLLFHQKKSQLLHEFLCNPWFFLHWFI